MGNRRKVALAVIAVLIGVAVISGIVMKRNYDNKVLLEQEAAKQLSQAYYNQNVAFRLYKDGNYHPMDDLEETEDGVYGERYFDLACYKKYTKNSLTYEQAREFLSQQYEEDGSIRIYNNGRHPEIEQYVEWAIEHESERNDYISTISLIYRKYFISYGIDENLNVYIMYRNQAILAELVKYEADPDYVMDEKIIFDGLDYVPLAESKS